MKSFIINANQSLAKLTPLDGIAPLLIRLYLAPIFILAGYGKLTAFENTVFYFSEYLNIPFPELMVLLAGSTELFGGIALLLGVAVRWFSLPLLVVMGVAAVTAHWQYGWHVLPESTLTMPWEWRTDLISAATEKKEMAQYLLKQHGNYSWLTEAGSITILKNGIEFAATYFVMLLVLLFQGGGRYISIDYWLVKYYGE